MTTKAQLEPMVDPILRIYIDAAINEALAPLTAQLEQFIVERATASETFSKFMENARYEIEILKGQTSLPAAEINNLVHNSVDQFTAPMSARIDEMVADLNKLKHRREDKLDQTPDENDKYVLTRAKIIRFMKENGIE